MKTFRSIIATTVCAGLGLALPLAASATGSNEVIKTYAGDGTTTALSAPGAMTRAPGGSGYLVADTLNNRIQKVATDGAVTTVVGTGVGGFNGDGLAASATKLFEPRGLARAGDGSVLIADTENHRVRRVAPNLGAVTTVVGTGTEGGLLGGLLNGLLGTDTVLDHPSAVAPLADGSFLVADTENNVIRKVDALGNMTTVAGDGTGGYSGDGGAATSAQLCVPEDVAVTDDGGFLIADTGNHVIRKVSATGTISTVAGTGTPGFSGDDGPPTSAKLNSPAGVEFKDGDRFFIADTGNNVIRRVQDGEIDTKAGDGAARFAGDGGEPERASLSGPRDLLRHNGLELISDTGNNRVRLVETLAPAVTEPVLTADEPVKLPLLGPDSEKGPQLPDPEPPKMGHHLQLGAAGGAVTVKMPGTGQYISLSDAASVPVGSVIDARRGKVRLTSAADGSGKTQSATFHGGTFQVGQAKSRPVTELRMRGGDFSPCWRRGATGAGPVKAAAKRRHKRKVRRLWGSGKGRFKTRGRHGAATVRGTVWLTEDSCAGTRVYVRHGLVAVRDLRRKRTVMVGKRQAYLAKSRGPKKR